MTTLHINAELNGLEITFAERPSTDTLNALKAAGFRWHKVRRMWYAKNTAERLTLAQSITGTTEATAPATIKKTDKINLDNLGENRPAHLGGAELSKAIREELKRRGVKGCTVKVSNYDSICVTWKTTAEDFASIEEAMNRVSIWDLFRYSRVYKDGHEVTENDYNNMTEEEKQEAKRETVKHEIDRFSNVYAGAWHTTRNERNYYFELSKKGFETLTAIIAIANQWNYDNSDSMTDYFDVGYYLDVDIKKPEGFTARENMTEDERNEYNAEVKAEEERKAAEMEAYQREQEEAHKRYEEAEKRRKEAHNLIENNITVEDLDEGNQVYVTDCIGGIGKESTIEELDETISTHGITSDTLITRKVHFATLEAFEAFGNLLIDDFNWLEGFGGSATEDVRLDESTQLYNLTNDQRESVKWYATNCVGCYLNGELMLICDPQGYTYSRYTYKPTTESRTRKANEAKQEQREQSEGLAPFYFPAPVEEQAEALEVGQDITIYQCDGWILNNIDAGAGTLAEKHPGEYAQYKGIWLTLQNGRKSRQVFIRNGNGCLIYKGIKNRLPDTVTRRKISENLYELLNYNELFPAVLDYYGKQGEKPILDTIQR